MEESPYDRLSSLSCNFRNNLDTNFCTELNQDNIKNPNLYFDKNKFSLSDQILKTNNISFESCASIALKNNYSGFTYTSDKNDCLLSSSIKNDDYSFKYNIEYPNYNIKTYVKDKNLIDIVNPKEQNDSSKYFSNYYNQNNKFNDDIYAEFKNISIDDCMDNCVKSVGNNCKSIFIPEVPKVCTFYKNKIMRTKMDNEEDNIDTFTIKKNNKIAELNERIDDSYINNNSKGIYCKNINNTCLVDSDKNEKENDIKIPWLKNTDTYIEKFENKHTKIHNNHFMIIFIFLCGLMIIFYYKKYSKWL